MKVDCNGPGACPWANATMSVRPSVEQSCSMALPGWRAWPHWHCCPEELEPKHTLETRTTSPPWKTLSSLKTPILSSEEAIAPAPCWSWLFGSALAQQQASPTGSCEKLWCLSDVWQRASPQAILCECTRLWSCSCPVSSSFLDTSEDLWSGMFPKTADFPVRLSELPSYWQDTYTCNIQKHSCHRNNKISADDRTRATNFSHTLRLPEGVHLPL